MPELAPGLAFPLIIALLLGGFILIGGGILVWQHYDGSTLRGRQVGGKIAVVVGLLFLPGTLLVFGNIREPVFAVEILPVEVTVAVGETVQLRAILRGPRKLVWNEDVLDYEWKTETLTGRRVTWSSLASQIVGVSPDGVVAAVGVGQAYVTARAEGSEGFLIINVTECGDGDDGP